VKKMKSSSHGLDSLFCPQSIAVVGASADPEKMGFRVMRNLVEGGFRGPLYPVNPKGGEVLGRVCVPSVRRLPKGVDLAILVIPRSGMLSALRECIDADVRSAVALTSGFREVGEEGDRVQEEMEALLKRTPFRLLGPNCAGFLNNLQDVYASIEIRPPKGNLSLISQSGSLMSAFASNMGARGLGVAKSVSMGNKVDVTEADLLEYLGEDEETHLIACYLEDLREGKRFLSIAREVSKKKPIVVLKAGRTPEGKKATFSHTGALAGEDRVIDGALRQVGIFRAETLDEFYDLSYGLSLSKPLFGNHIGILSDAGGPGVIATDAAVGYGFRILPPSQENQEELRRFLPPFSSVANPIDMTFTRDVSWYARALGLLSKEPWHGFLVIIPSHFTVRNELAETLIDASRHIAQPLFVSWLSPWEIPETMRQLTQNKVPVYTTPERAIHVMAKLASYGRWLSNQGRL
jgi:acyl-CoA synthetase (NDP forming)